MVCEDLNFKPGKVNSFMPNTTILERFIYTLSRCVHFSVFTQNMNCVTIIFVNLLLFFSTCVRVNSNAKPKQNFRSQKVERQTMNVTNAYKLLFINNKLLWPQKCKRNIMFTVLFWFYCLSFKCGIYRSNISNTENETAKNLLENKFSMGRRFFHSQSLYISMIREISLPSKNIDTM